MDSTRSFQEPPRSASPPTVPGPTLTQPSTRPRRAQGRKSPAMPREPFTTKDLRLIRGRSLNKVPPLIGDPSSTKRPRSTKDPLTKGLRSTRSMRPALRSVVAQTIRWTWIRPLQSLPKGSPSRSRRCARVMRLGPRSTRTVSTSPGTNQRSRWPCRRECQWITRSAVTRLTRSRRKTSSGRSQTHPGPASSPEPPRARTLVRRRARAATRRHRNPSWSSLVRGDHRSRRSP